MQHNGHTIALIGEEDVFTTVVRPEPFYDVADTETETSGGNVYRGRQCGRRTKLSVASGVETIVGGQDRGTCFPFGVGGFDAAHHRVANDASESYVEGHGGRDQGVFPEAVCALYALRIWVLRR